MPTDPMSPEEMPIAWVTRAASNGKITRVTRWHRSLSYQIGARTLCGKRIPHTKHFTRFPDYLVKGGNCKACNLTTPRQ